MTSVGVMIGLADLTNLVNSLQQRTKEVSEANGLRHDANRVVGSIARAAGLNLDGEMIERACPSILSKVGELARSKGQAVEADRALIVLRGAIRAYIHSGEHRISKQVKQRLMELTR